MTSEFVQMAPMLVIAGVLVSWLSQLSLTARGHGFLADTALSLAGSGAAGLLAWELVAADPGLPVMFAIGAGGAALAILGQRGLWPHAGV